MRVVVALPTKNEEAGIREMIVGIREAGFRDIIVVDEMSTDHTVLLALREGAAIYQRDGRGKGYAIVKALEVAASCEVEALAILDADCTYPPRFIPVLLQELADHDMVVGTRDLRKLAYLHEVANRLHTWTINYLYGVRLHDINSGMRVLRVKQFADRIEGCGFDIEAQLTIRAIRGGLRVREVPIEYVAERKGRSKIKAWDAFRILRRILTEWRGFRANGVRVSGRRGPRVSNAQDAVR
ncbi:MAG: glycosyltransferase [Candidatus Rokubacteria bacterium]|nr:glycosyltransferase [Candidatus Rokubacteria bacterium]